MLHSKAIYNINDITNLNYSISIVNPKKKITSYSELVPKKKKKLLYMAKQKKEKRTTTHGHHYSSTTHSPTTATATAHPLSCTDHCATMDILVIIEVTFLNLVTYPFSYITSSVTHLSSSTILASGTLLFYVSNLYLIVSLL